MLRRLSLFLLALAAAPVAAQVCGDEPSAPYIFILFDTSGSMNWAPPCSPADITNGLCTYPCAGPECFVPLQADSPDSKFFQVKAALHDSLSAPESDNALFGFAVLNQDALNARSKHWLYEAAADGVTIPGWGPFPAAGSREIVGRTWTCDQGSGDAEAGCTTVVPADLSDAWELGRVRELAKGGASLTQVVAVFVRHLGITYRVQYTPVAGGTLGAAVSFRVRVDRCTNAACSTRVLLGEPTVPYTPVAEHLIWDNAVSRTEPIGYFQTDAADAGAGNTCSGWEPNTDAAADAFNSYSLRWPNVMDARGSFFTSGDMIPFDWMDDHRLAIQIHLAPNLVADAFAAPDFTIAPYLQDQPLAGQAYLRLKNEKVRPLLATGSTPLGAALRSFRAWYAGCSVGVCPSGGGWQGQAALQDPYFFCRRKNLIVITDGEETCGVAPCSDAAALYSQHGIRVWGVGYGVNPSANTSVGCISAGGGAFYPRNPSELLQTLQDIYTAASQP
jgi:hypothetical protein